MFKKGDRIVIKEDNLCIKKGMKGTVINEKNSIGYPVKFDNRFNGGHDCFGKCKEGYGLWVLPCYMELIQEQEIHIYSDGTTTTAILKDGKETIKKSTAKCSPDDTFDFNTGAKLAFERLMETNEVREVKRMAKVGEWVKVTKKVKWHGNESNIGDKFVIDHINSISYEHCYYHYAKRDEIMFSQDEYVVLQNYKPDVKPVEVAKPFIPHLISNRTESEYGAIGEATPQVDLLGNNLKIGDTVKLYRDKECKGECSIVGDKQGYFVMGLKGGLFINGRHSNFSIIKNRSYDEIPNGEIIDMIKYIKE